MNEKNVAQSDNENKGTLRHHIDAVVAPNLGSGKGAAVEGSIAAPAPVSTDRTSEPVAFEQRGTEDIAHVYRNGEVRYFPATPLGAIESNYYFESHARRIFSIHFGETCYYVNKEGKIGARVQMTRREFWLLMQTAHGIEVAV